MTDTMENMIFDICLRIRSEVVTLQEISSTLKKKPSITHRMGELRKTPRKLKMRGWLQLLTE